ncbi:MAG: hypothetical protein R3D29_12270 [Nitratireductor sp.]
MASIFARPRRPLTSDPELLTLGGETRPLSVLFTDVRKFTTISESYKKTRKA